MDKEINLESDLPEEMDSVSEGWWESVMAEDSCYAQASERKKRPPLVLDEKPAETIVMAEETNWGLIEDMYHDEAVVTGTVVDYNKGGLLVCAAMNFRVLSRSHIWMKSFASMKRKRAWNGWKNISAAA